MSDFREKILWWAANKRLRADKPFIIAVGGAIAKTTTKEMVGQMMKRAYPGEVVVGYGNLNTYLGVPMSILNIKVDFHQGFAVWRWLPILLTAIKRAFSYHLPKKLVLELGTDHDGDLDLLTKQIQPDIGIITIVGPAHVGNYSSEEAIALDEGFMAERTKEGGVVFLNHIDPHLEEHKKRAKAKVIIVDSPLEQIAQGITKAIAEYLGIDNRLADEVINNFAAPKHRLNKITLGSHQVIDDTYNASPFAMEAAFTLFSKLPPRRVMFLGDMLELGPSEEKYHREVGKKAREIADVVVGVGERAKWYQPNYWFPTSEEAAKGMFAFIKEGDTILVKGSRGIRMEKIIEGLKHGHS